MVDPVCSISISDEVDGLGVPIGLDILMVELEDILVSGSWI
jgi:hypothetical protein